MISVSMCQKEQTCMGTVMSHKAYGMYAEDSLNAIIREISRLEELFSRFLPESEISQINQAAGKTSVAVSAETIEILAFSKHFASLCNGCFDVTIAPLVTLWNIGKDTFTQPAKLDIHRTLSLVNYHDLILDFDTKTIGLDKIGQAIDLGSIGKGYAGNCILEIYRAFGIQSAYSNLGGNVVTLGDKPDGNPWYIGIQHPRQADRLLGRVAITDQSVVTSGDYQRFSRNSQGGYFHHLLSPETGYPVSSGLISVTVVSDNSMIADALSTALFVMGISRGVEFLLSFPKTDAILVDAEEQVFVTRGLKEKFHPAVSIQITVLN